MEIIIPYYEDNTRISNSAIGWFLNKGPQYLRDMLDNKEEGLSGKFLERGTMIHEYILQPEEFWKDYEGASRCGKCQNSGNNNFWHCGKTSVRNTGKRCIGKYRCRWKEME